MQKLIITASIAAIVSLSQLAYAAPIGDTYNTGDTLTTTHMNNIKSAVNDNDTRIDTKQNEVTGTCAPGSAIRVINANGTVTCETDDGTVVDFGSVLTEVAATGPTGETSEIQADCPASTYATGGGCAVPVATAGAFIKIDEPVVTGVALTGWNCTCVADVGETCTVTATAVCAANIP